MHPKKTKRQIYKQDMLIAVLIIVAVFIIIYLITYLT